MLCVYTDGKVSMILIRKCVPKMQDFSRVDALQAVTYTVHRKSVSTKETARDRHIVTRHH